MDGRNRIRLGGREEGFEVSGGRMSDSANFVSDIRPPEISNPLRHFRQAVGSGVWVGTTQSLTSEVTSWPRWRLIV